MNCEDSKIEQYVGQACVFTNTLEDDNGVIDVTGWRFRFTLSDKINQSSEDNIFVKEIATFAEPGTADVVISSNDLDISAGIYKYLQEWIDPTNNTIARLVGDFILHDVN